MSPPHVALVIDNDHDVLEEVEVMLSSLGHECHCATNQEEAEAFLAELKFCYVVLDLHLPVKGNRMPRIQTGFNILENIRQQFSADELPVIIMTAHGSGHEYSVRAFKRGATDYVKKPFDSDSEPFEDKVREAMGKTCEARHRRCPNCRSSLPDGAAENGESGTKPEPPSAEELCVTGPSLHFIGTCRRRRYLMMINGEEVRVQQSTFACLLKLAARLKRNPPGWVHGTDLSESNYHSVIHRLRQDLRQLLNIDDGFIEGDGHSKFRLSVPPENLSFDEACLRADHPHLLRLLSEA